MKHSKAKERENERQRRYFRDDIEQPFTRDGKRNRKFERIYGDDIVKQKRYAEQKYD